MRALRRGIVVAVFVVCALIVPLPFEQRSGAALGDLAHAPLFASLAYGVLRVWNRLRPASTNIVRRIVIVVGMLILFGGAMEIVQGYMGRSPAWHDAIANSIGALAGALWFFGGALGRAGHAAGRWIGRFAAVALIAVASWGPALTLIDVGRVRLQFPMLASFESPMEMTRWHFGNCSGEMSTVHVTSGDHGMRLTFQPTDHPAATLLDVHGDWSDITAIELDVSVDESVSEQVEFVLKVIDDHHADYHGDVFRKTFWLDAGQAYSLSATREEIVAGPRTRDLDLSAVKHVSVQILKPTGEVVLYLDALRVQI